MSFTASWAQDVPLTERRLAPEELQDLIRQAGSENVRLLVIERDPAGPVPADEGVALATAVEAAERRLVSIERAADADLEALQSRIAAHWPAEGWNGLVEAALLATLACAVAWLIEWFIRGRIVIRRSAEPVAAEAHRYLRLLRSVAANILGLIFQIGLATAIFVAVTDRGTPERDVGYAIILVGCLCLRLGIVLIDLFLEQARAARAGAVDLRAVASVRRKGMLLAAVLAILVSGVSAIDRLDLGPGLFEASRLIAAVLFVAALAAALWVERRAISDVVFREPVSPAARIWPRVALAYLTGSLVLFLVLILNGVPVRGFAILAPIYWGAIAIIIYAVCMAFLLRYRSRGAVSKAQIEPPAAIARPSTTASGETAAAPSDAAALAGTIAMATWAGGLALAWGVPLWSDETDRIHGFWAILLILLLARIAWIVIRAFFDRRIAEERVSAGPAETGDEGGAKGSRLGTVLPLCRSFLLITVAVIAAMVVLAQLGLSIGPIFAGAGLVGVAVGFGAQSLVKDIFSGLFFLIDDAFRVGEYIETGGLRGTVERISIRSMQLRHQNGPLHTIPFGEVTQLTNYSRDWVIMKLPIRVTFDTDPELVRRLVKKLGQDLMADPALGDKFVEPLKSQGVREIDDSGQIIRVKFMTRPGEQFVLRKIVYARIRELFAREGIEFAAREVRVRVTTQGEPLSEEQIEKIAGAAAEGTLGP